MIIVIIVLFINTVKGEVIYFEEGGGVLMFLVLLCVLEYIG